jgi:hypothetical protein
VCGVVHGTDVTDALNHYEAYLKTLDFVDFRYEIPSSSEKGKVRRGGNNIRCLIRQYNDDQLLSLTEMISYEGNGIIYRCRGEDVGRLTSRIRPNKNDYAMERLFDFPFILGYFPITESNDITIFARFFSF